MSERKRLGLVVNPIAGMGGPVGLKGTDGLDILEQAVALGAVPHSGRRAVVALRALSELKDDIHLLTFPGAMGEDPAREAGFDPEVLLGEELSQPNTTREDTLLAVGELLRQGVDLLLFAGGDGTARDVFEGVGESVPVLGIPAGVKIHSAVFGCSPAGAGELARLFLRGEEVLLKLAEVMDIDEDVFREGRVAARLYGYLRIPYERRRVQGLKAGSPISEERVQHAIARYVAESLIEPNALVVVGPGTTTRALLSALGVEATLLGVDCVLDGRLVGKDIDEIHLLELCRSQEHRRLVLTPIGGQGFLLGRGNQQVSASVLKFFEPDDLLVLCTPTKLQALEGAPLLLDTGDETMDRKFSGYVRMITGFMEYTAYPVRGVF